MSWFPSPSRSTQWKHWQDKQGRKPRALHDVALCGPTTIFNNCQPCLGNGGLAWRRFCLLFCWAACNVQNRTPLEPRAASAVSPYFCCSANLSHPLSTHPEFFSLSNTLGWWPSWYRVWNCSYLFREGVLRGAKESIHLKAKVNLHLVQGRCPFSQPWGQIMGPFTKSFHC